MTPKIIEEYTLYIQAPDGAHVVFSSLNMFPIPRIGEEVARKTTLNEHRGIVGPAVVTRVEHSITQGRHGWICSVSVYTEDRRTP